MISTNSQWYDKLRAEIKYFEDIKIDIDKLISQSREADKIRGQMVVLERRVQILHEEKSVLTTMERRLQERCAELQREVFRLQGAAHTDGYKSLEKRPVALPRQVLPRSNKNGSFEHEDEGISSSETGQSLSPEPIIILPPSSNSKKYTLTLTDGANNGGSSKDDDTNATIEDVIEELENIVQDAEREIKLKSEDANDDAETVTAAKFQAHMYNVDHVEQEIVPVNLLPQPPKKSRSLAHLISSGSEFDDSDYGVLMNENHRVSYYDDIDMEIENSRAHGCHNDVDGDVNVADVTNPDLINQSSSNRELLNVIMDAQENDDRIFAANAAKVNRIVAKNNELIPKLSGAPQKFNGVFFMTEMSTPQKYPKPDITAALEARRVTKSIERMESHGLDSMIDIIMTSPDKTTVASKCGSNPPKNNFQAMREMSSMANATFLMRNKSPAPENNNATIIFSNGAKTTRATAAYTITGSKLTDLPSGLY